MTQVTSTELKILSYNIHKGFAAGAKRFVLPHIREVLKSVDADLVFLQEVLGQHNSHAERVGEHWPVEPQFEYIAHELWPHFTYGKNAMYTDGHHGNAILSKHAFVKWENIDVSNNRFEKRGLLHGVISVPNFAQELHSICIHLDLFESGREAQVARLCERINASVPADAPLIVAGDFNDWRQRVSHVLEDQLGLIEIHKNLHGKHARTFPSWFPLLKLDRIYCRGLKFTEAKSLTGAPWNQLSDHAALYATVSAAEELSQIESTQQVKKA